MNTASICRSSALFRSFTNTCALAFASLLACGTHLKPTVAEVSGRAVELVETGVGTPPLSSNPDWAMAGLPGTVSPVKSPAERGCSPIRAQATVAVSHPTRREPQPGRRGSQEPAHGPGLCPAVHLGGAFLRRHVHGALREGASGGGRRAGARGFASPRLQHRLPGAGLSGYSIPESAVGSLPQVQQDEFYGFASASAEIRAAGTFGLYPVRVLTSTSHPWSATVEALWQSMHGALAHEAANGQQIVFEGASHNLELDRAHEVAEVILSLIPESKNLTLTPPLNL